MKNIITLFLITTMLSCCSKDDKPSNPIDQLPPATQVGANKVGCLLDGVAFLPSNLTNSTNCFYQFVDGGYYFYLNFNNSNNNISKSISLGTENSEINEGQILNLFERSDGNAYGLYLYGTIPYYTNTTQTGKLKITRFTDQIVSGTFWFDVMDNNGIVHHITDGRFDMQYTN